MSVILAPISKSLPEFLGVNNYSKIAVILDKNTKKHCLPFIESYLPKGYVKIIIPPGEEEKNLKTAEIIWSALTKAKFDRHSLVINLGGGVIGDMGGFCASTYKRGIDFIQIPTTLLAQVDASVGGKLGIDFNGFKNHIGVFSLPKFVFIDTQFIHTLPEREKRSGFAEIIKHSLIQDKAIWNRIQSKDWQELNFEELVAESVAIKEKVVEEDPKEKGIRKILNFGHTLGHAVETFFLSKGKKKLLHGEAIAVGMIMESFLSFKKNLITEQELEEIQSYLFVCFGKVKIKKEDYPAIIQLTKQDKKNVGRSVRFSLIAGIGNCYFDIGITDKEMKEALEYYH